MQTQFNTAPLALLYKEHALENSAFPGLRRPQRIQPRAADIGALCVLAFIVNSSTLPAKAIIEYEADVESYRAWAGRFFTGGPEIASLREIAARSKGPVGAVVNSRWKRLALGKAKSNRPVKHFEVVNLEKSQAPVLDLSGDFVPSESLLDIWRASFSEISVGTAANKTLLREWPKNKNYVRQEFYRRLKSVISDYAFDRSYQSDGEYITVNRRMNPLLQIRMVDAFIITPDRSNIFLGTLLSELSYFLHQGNIIRGQWGDLQFVNGDLYINLKKSRKISKRGFEKGILTEI